MSLLKKLKPNEENVSAGWSGLFSGVIVMFWAVWISYEGPFLFFFGAAFGLVALSVLVPILKKHNTKKRNLFLWSIYWLILSILSWYAALYMILNIYSDFFYGVFIASTVGVTILFLGIIQWLKCSKVVSYFALVGGTGFLGMFAFFVGGLFGADIIGMLIIHPIWQAATLYVIVSLIN